MTLRPESSAWYTDAKLAGSAGKIIRDPGKQVEVIMTEIMLELEQLIVPVTEMSTLELNTDALRPDAEAKKGGRKAFDVPLDATTNSWKGYTRKPVLAGRSIILALPLTTFMPLSRKNIAAS